MRGSGWRGQSRSHRSDELVESANDRLVLPDVQQRDKLLGHNGSPGIVDPALVVICRVPVGSDEMGGTGIIGGSEQYCLSTTLELASSFEHSPIRIEVFECLGLTGCGTEGEKAANQVHSRDLGSSSGQMLTLGPTAGMCAQHNVRHCGCARPSSSPPTAAGRAVPRTIRSVRTVDSPGNGVRAFWALPRRANRSGRYCRRSAYWGSGIRSARHVRCGAPFLMFAYAQPQLEKTRKACRDDSHQSHRHRCRRHIHRCR